MSLRLDKTAWKRVTLGEVVRHVTDRIDVETSGLERFLAGEHIPSGSLAITDWGVIGRDPIGPMFYKRFQPGHVLYVSRRTYLRKVAVPDFEGITGEKTFVLESIDRGILLQEFLPFVLSAEIFHDYAIRNSRGSVNPYLNWGELAAYEFDLPPLDDQKRIADLIWAVERHRRALRRLNASLVAATSQLLSSQLRPGDEDISKYADVLVGFAFASNYFKREASAESRPLLRGINVGVGATRWEDSDTMYWAEPLTDRTMKYVLAAGDVVIPMDRPFTADGRLRWAELNEAEDGALLVQRVARLRPRDPTYSPLVRAIVRSSQFQSALNGSLTGSFAPHLAHSDFVRYQLTAPSPEIAARQMAKAESAEVSIDRERARLDSIRSSVLADVFGGI